MIAEAQPLSERDNVPYRTKLWIVLNSLLKREIDYLPYGRWSGDTVVRRIDASFCDNQHSRQFFRRLRVGLDVFSKKTFSTGDLVYLIYHTRGRGPFWNAVDKADVPEEWTDWEDEDEEEQDCDYWYRVFNPYE